MMYDNGGSIKNNRVMVESRLRTTIKEDVWLKITDAMVKDGDYITHKSINKRLSRTIASRENGKLGGRPKKKDEYEENLDDKKPTKPKKETYKNPRLEIEREIEREIEKKKESKKDGDKSPTYTQAEIDLFNKFREWIEEKAPRVCRMKEPLTIKQFFALKKKYDSRIISEILIAMQNRADLHKKYVSAYLTINNWAKNQTTNTNDEQPIQTRVRKSEATR